jgi:hypothetical protein
MRQRESLMLVASEGECVATDSKGRALIQLLTLWIRRKYPFPKEGRSLL